MNFADKHGLRAGVVAYRQQNNSSPALFSFGHDGKANEIPASSELKFKLASLSKPVTAALVLKVLDERKMSTDTPLASLLPSELLPLATEASEITVRQLLQHTAGFDTQESFDPFFMTEEELASRTEHTKQPVKNCTDVLQIMREVPLQFSPGTAYAYSNLGYCYLEKIIETATGLPYEQAVRQYLPETKAFTLSVDNQTIEYTLSFPERDWLVSRPQVISAAGGWISDISSYWEFASTALNPAVATPPPFPQSRNYYGLGWRVWKNGNEQLFTHFGAMPDVFTVVIRDHSGPLVLALFLGRPGNPDQAFAEFYQQMLPLLP
ncbi:serine hydrolase domain-containing protein [Kiloniella sp. b19]|uniref:serine hydrolase domain-containing protein n=1 Tax=Kiloniella sp. GXU_MW_B19 TaxID=3141326 RepID=UPI0031E236B2